MKRSCAPGIEEANAHSAALRRRRVRVYVDVRTGASDELNLLRSSLERALGSVLRRRLTEAAGFLATARRPVFTLSGEADQRFPLALTAETTVRAAKYGENDLGLYQLPQAGRVILVLRDGPAELWRAALPVVVLDVPETLTSGELLQRQSELCEQFAKLATDAISNEQLRQMVATLNIQ